MQCIKITGPWCNITYTPISKRDNGVKFLKAIRKVQLTRAKNEEKENKMIYKGNRRWIPSTKLINPKNIGLKIEIIN